MERNIHMGNERIHDSQMDGNNVHICFIRVISWSLNDVRVCIYIW